MAEVIGIPLAIVAGMIVSGATFGDKLSPISDTTNLAAMSAGTHPYRHIYAMLYTTVPAFVLTLIIFTMIGMQYSDRVLPVQEIASIQSGLESVFRLSLWITALPLVCMLVMSIKRYSPVVSMSCSIVLAMLIAIIYQERNIIEVFNSLWLNQPGNTGIENIDTLLGRGGIYSMAWTLLLSIMALALGHPGSSEILSVIRIHRATTYPYPCRNHDTFGLASKGRGKPGFDHSELSRSRCYHKAHLDSAVSRPVEEGLR